MWKNWRMSRQRASLVSLAVLAVLLGTAAPGRAEASEDGAYQVVGFHEERIGPLVLSEWTVQAGADPAARFTVHRPGYTLIAGGLPDGLTFEAPVLAIQAGHGFGLWMNDNLELLGSDDISTDVRIDFAHGDHYASPRHRSLLEQPIYDWLKQVVDR